MPGLVERLRGRARRAASAADEAAFNEAADRIERDGAVLEDVKYRIDMLVTLKWYSNCPVCEGANSHLGDCALAEAVEVER